MSGMQAVDPGIIENIGPVAPLTSQTEIVDVGCGTVLECCDQLMLAAVEAALASIGLVPDQQVFPFTVDWPGCRQQFRQMSPIHENEMDRAVLAMSNGKPNERLKKGGKLPFGHFPRCNLELPMSHPAPPHGMAMNFDVERRIRDYH